MALSKEDINTGNEIIALFMDGVYYEAWGNPEYNCPFSHFYFKHEETLDRKVCGDLKYHSSWDWLMPVVEKISDMCAYENGTGVTVLGISMLTPEKWRCHINYRIRFGGIKSEHKSFDITKESPVDAAWTAVTQFIKWYNTQSTQQ